MNGSPGDHPLSDMFIHGRADPTAMLEFLRGQAGERKLRLFACACCRRIWHLLGDERSRRAVEVAERYADGESSADRLRLAIADALEAEQDLGEDEGEGGGPQAEALYLAAHAATAAAEGQELEAVLSAGPTEWAAHLALLRELFGNPFSPSRLDPVWLTPAVVSLAQAAYEERDFPSGHLDPQRLAVLADALEDAGCADAAILGHLRGHGPHVRGCWVLDCILQKK